MKVWIAIAIGCSDPPVTGDEPTDDGPTPFANDNDADGHEPPFDCDDGDAQVYPGHGEFCNGKDDDCDGAIDDDAVDGNEGFVDADGDKAGDSNRPLVSCVVPGWSPVGGDCDDSDATRSPDVEEVCNGIDEDCTGAADDGGFIGNVHYQTIQDAIFAADDDETIELCPDSTQMESGILVDRDVTITSEVGDPARVVIDGSDRYTSVFVVDGGDLVLEGLTLRGGDGLPTDLYAGGSVPMGGAVNALVGARGHVTVRNCLFESNRAAVGGAIAAFDLDVADSTFLGNLAADPVFDFPVAGAIWIGQGGGFTIERTLFDGNSATDGNGGALEVWSSGLLIDVEAVGNTAGRGGFAHVSGTGGYPVSVTLVRADIHDNAAVQGGGVELYRASATADEATRIHDNTAVDGAGVAIVGFQFEELVTWSGGTIESNTADVGGGGMLLDTSNGGSIALDAAVVRDNEAEDGGGIYAVGAAGDLPAADVSLDDLEITGNVAAARGGGLWGDKVWFALSNGAVSNNSAMEGGGAYVAATTTLDVAATAFANNEPQDVFVEGGVMFEADDASATFTCTGADAACQ